MRNMEYRRTTLNTYDEENPTYDSDDVETRSWVYPEERKAPFYVLWDEMKKLISRCFPKRTKTDD